MPEFDPLEMPIAEFATNALEADEDTPAAESEDTSETEQPNEEPVVEAEAEAPVEAEADGNVSTLDEDLRELEFPDLPPELASDPGTHKRWLETQKGIKNMLDTVQPYYKYVKALEDPATQAEAFEALYKATGYRPPGVQAPEAATVATDGDFEYEGERLAYERAVAEVERRYGPQLKQLAETQEQTAQERAFTAMVDKQAPAVIGYFGKAEGFPVTKDMVATALKQHPGADPIQAVKMAHIDAYVAHKAGKPVKKGPEMPSGGSSAAKGMALPNVAPEDYADLTAAQVSSVLSLLPDD